MSSKESIIPDICRSRLSVSDHKKVISHYLGNSSTHCVGDIEVRESVNSADACKNIRSEDGPSADQIDWDVLARCFHSIQIVLEHFLDSILSAFDDRLANLGNKAFVPNV